MSAIPSILDRVMQRVGQFFFRWRNTLFPLIFLATAVLVRPARVVEGTRGHVMVVALGALAVVAGQLVRALTVGLVYIKRGGKNKRVYAESLVQEGVYAHTRNPMYLGNLLIAAGFCLLYGSPWMYAVVFPCFWCVYQCVTRAEEMYLTAKFGDVYRHYQRTVPRFVPRLAGFADTLRLYTYDWRQLIKKEYGTLFSTFLGLYGLILLQLGLLPVACRHSPLALVLALPVAATTAAYFGARVMKKTGRLVGPAAADQHSS